jgi:beta-lactamase superfamily II metal-dependent hydrolase
MDTLELVCLQVGNADCVVLSTSNKHVVVDLPQPERLRRWLLKKDVRTLAAVYITHPHRDHFAPIERFVSFVKDWGAVEAVYLPHGAIQQALTASRGQDPLRHKRVVAAIQELISLTRRRLVRVEPFFATNTHRYGSAAVTALHPGFLFAEVAATSAPGNSISLVLRVSLGQFHAILAADADSSAITEMLATENLEFKAQVLKIPHHGAWPTDSTALREFLRRVDPEFAILSVGSKNTYGHVRPELFRALLELKTKRLERFACTEVTRTCQLPAEVRATMGNAGLDSVKPCAGDITILANTDGTFKYVPATPHDRVIETVPHAACDGRGDLRVP